MLLLSCYVYVYKEHRVSPGGTRSPPGPRYPEALPQLPGLLAIVAPTFCAPSLVSITAAATTIKSSLKANWPPDPLTITSL